MYHSKNLEWRHNNISVIFNDIAYSIINVCVILLMNSILLFFMSNKFPINNISLWKMLNNFLPWGFLTESFTFSLTLCLPLNNFFTLALSWLFFCILSVSLSLSDCLSLSLSLSFSLSPLLLDGFSRSFRRIMWNYI